MNEEGVILEFINDAEITAAIKAKLVVHELLSAFKIHVETHEGVVVLTGEGLSTEAQDLATNIAKDTEGVVKVFTSWEQDEILD
jgi:hyperosmotically inducible protein